LKKQLVLFFVLAISTIFSFAGNDAVVWNMDNLTSIGGYTVTTYGNPKVIYTPNGNAIEFDGINSRIQVAGYPLGTATNFTIEVIFNPYNSETSVMPRILHVEETAMSANKRITVECRFDGNGNWYGDTFLKDPTSNLTLSNASKIHMTDQWTHIALTYDGTTMKQYVNGVEELSGSVAFGGVLSIAQVSLGGRMNNVNYLKGAIRKVIFTPTALAAAQFTYDGTTVGVKNTTYEGYDLAQNTPNPVVNNTVISYTLARREQVRINVYDSMGKKIQTLVDGVMSEGKQEVTFEKGNFPVGMYFYTITTASGYKETKKMMIQ
jgi:hypothetical protein